MNPLTRLRRFVWRKKQLNHWDQYFKRSDSNRITLVSQFFPPDFAATGQLLDDLTQRLALTGIKIQVLTGMPAYAYSQAEAEPVEFQPGRVIFRSRASRFWPRRIRGRAVNGLLFCIRASLRLLKYSRRGDRLIYTTEPPYLPIVGFLVYLLTRTPYILVLYDLYPDVLIELGVIKESHPVARFWRFCNLLAYRNARDIVVLSASMRQRVVFSLGEPRGRIHLIPSWADTDVIKPLDKTSNWFVQRYSLADTFNVLYSGNQGRCHDLVTLMAAALILRGDSTIRFVFIGSGPQNQRIKDLAHDWDLTNCLFLPYQDFEVLPWSLSCADLAVVSLGVKSVGLVAPSKLYGHIAAGTPLAIISPANSDLRAYVDGGLGAWFANGDANGLAQWIRSIAVDRVTHREMSIRCRRVAELEYSSSVVTSTYSSILFGKDQSGLVP